MAHIAIEEHWNLPELTSAVKALPEDRGDPSIALDELGDNLERLDDIGDARIAAMDAQGIDLQILSLAPPGTHPLEPADARTLSRRANDIAAEAVHRRQRLLPFQYRHHITEGTAMTLQGNGSPTRAVVLGGGGTVGVAWQTGLLAGLREAGANLAEAPAIVGTSAGSLVGAMLACGRDVTDALAILAEVGKKLDFDSLGAGSQNFLDASRQAVFAADPRQALRAIGAAAQEASTTLTEDDYLGLLGTLDGVAWPAGFRCTAIDTGTGELVVWSEESGVPLLHAVAASCVVPMLFPTVTINGNHYMDGGIVNHLNAAAAPPSDVVVVVSCLPLEAPSGAPGSDRSPSTIKADAEVVQLRENTRLVAVDPDFGDLEAPVKMMDPETAGRAFHIGRRQAEREAAAIRAVWDS